MSSRAKRESSLTAWAPQWNLRDRVRTGGQGRSAGSRSQGSGHSRGEQHPDIRGERKFREESGEETTCVWSARNGSFARSFTLANTVNSDAIRGLPDGVLTLTPEERKSQAEADQGERRDSGDGRVRSGSNAG